MFKSRIFDLGVLLVICAVAFWWRLGALGLIDPDEPFYAQTAREMVQGGDWLTPHIYGKPQFEKPIFYYWLVSGSFLLFGENEFSGRLPTALFSTALVLLVWAFGSRAWNPRTGFLGALLLATGLEYAVMSRLMLTDVPLAFFLSGAAFCYWLAIREEAQRDRWIFLSRAFTGLAVLTKGPLGSIVPLLANVVFAYVSGRPLIWRGRGVRWGVLAYAVIVVPWYALMFSQHARQFWSEFFVRDNFLRMIRAEHPANNHWWYYPGLLLLGSIPWMPVIAVLVRRIWTERWRQDEAALFQWIWLLTSLVFLSAAQSKLPSYAFYLFVPLALLAARVLDVLFTHGFSSNFERRLFWVFALIQAVGVLALPLFKVAKPFGGPVFLVSGFLLLSLVFLSTKKWLAWALSSSAASLALLVGALTISLPAVEAESSARPVAHEMLRVQRSGEPLISGKFLVRGILFYTRQPVWIFANKAHPFWADHPLPVITGKREMRAFLAAHSGAVCGLRRGDWALLEGEKAFAEQLDFTPLGENIVVRAQGGSQNPATRDQR